jgi:hypothetical protein
MWPSGNVAKITYWHLPSSKLDVNFLWSVASGLSVPVHDSKYMACVVVNAHLSRLLETLAGLRVVDASASTRTRGSRLGEKSAGRRVVHVAIIFGFGDQLLWNITI